MKTILLIENSKVNKTPKCVLKSSRKLPFQQPAERIRCKIALEKRSSRILGNNEIEIEEGIANENKKSDGKLCILFRWESAHRLITRFFN